MTHAEAMYRINTHHHHLMRWGIRTLLGILRVAEPVMASPQRHRELCEQATLLVADLDDAVAAGAAPLPDGWVSEEQWRQIVHKLDRAFVRLLLAEALLIATKACGVDGKGGDKNA